MLTWGENLVGVETFHGGAEYNILLLMSGRMGGSLQGYYEGLSCRVVLSEPLSSRKEL